MTNPKVEKDMYDPHIVPAETAARKEREKEGYKQIPHEQNVNEETIDTSGGYTMDGEGLVDNFAIEPEMYYETPGDLREQEKARVEERRQELHDIDDNDETGKLTMEKDERGKGSGLI